MTNMKRVFYLPSGYKSRTTTKVEGRAKTGEISPKGLVGHTHHWDGRIAANPAPAGIRYIRDPDGTNRPMTFTEMVAHGYFIMGRGPVGVRLKGIR